MATDKIRNFQIWNKFKRVCYLYSTPIFIIVSASLVNINAMIILVGAPGSGKSHFARALLESDTSNNRNRFVRINQDELKTRQKCETNCKRALSNNQIPIIDRCNFNGEQRYHFVNIAEDYSKRTRQYIPIHIVEFHTPIEECIRRCKERPNHETITAQNAAMVVRRMYSQLDYPSSRYSHPSQIASSPYASIIKIHNFKESDATVSSILQWFN